jgi:hypothetical protein
MSNSALTNAALATNPVAYWPMEDAAGSTTAADVGPNNLPLSLAGTSASSHISPGQAAQVPGSSGSWSSDGTTGTYLTRAVTTGSPLQIYSAFTFAGWLNLSSVPNTVEIGRPNNWTAVIAPYLGAGAWVSANKYTAGTACFYSGLGYKALIANTNVTPGTDNTWEPVYFSYEAAKFTGSTPTISSDTIAMNSPMFLALTYDGYELKLFINDIEQGMVITHDTITASTDALGIFGIGSAALIGYSWGCGVWNTKLDRGVLRSIYEAGVGSANIATSAPFIDTVEDSELSAITANAIEYFCPACSGKIRNEEGYIITGGKHYHQGCYQARRVYANASVLSASSVLNDFIDRDIRLAYDFLEIASRRSLTDKFNYHDGMQFQPIQESNTFWRSQTSAGAYAALLARYSRANSESWLVDLGRRTAEFIISKQIGMDSSVLAPGYTFDTSTGAAAGSNPKGMYAPSFDTTLNAQSWVLRDLCFIYLSLKNFMPQSTLARWEESILAGANFLHSGTYNQAASAPPYLNDHYYVNGNYMLRYSMVYWLVEQVTGDSATWGALYNSSYEYALYPYGTPLTWLGIWNASTNYNSTNTPNGPHAVRYNGLPYKCISSITGSSGNSAPSSDTTHWTVLNTTTSANAQGYGMQIVHQGSDSTYWSDYWGYVAEYGSGAGGGPAGSALAGQPGYDGDYNSLQTDYCSTMWFLTRDPKWQQLANMLMNSSGLYPSGGGTNNPSATPFSYSACFSTTPSPGATGVWVIDKTSGASGGYSTRHSLLDGYRQSWLPLSILTGARPDLNSAFPYSAYASHGEPDFKNAWIYSGFSENSYAQMVDIHAQYLFASPNWPGFPD